MLSRGRRVRRADGLDSRRRAAAAPADRRDRRRAGRRKKYVYLCTNALKLEECLPRFTPSKYFSFSVHMDGPREEHDLAVCRDGVYDIAVRAIRAAHCRRLSRDDEHDAVRTTPIRARFREFFDKMMELGVEGMMISPGYSYAKAPDQDHFLKREQTGHLFRRLAGESEAAWRFNQSPLFLEFLKGDCDLECTPWGKPTYNLFGWQTAVLPARRGLSPDVPGIDGHDRLGALRPRQRQPEVPRLHGPLRLRADRGHRDVRLAPRTAHHGPADTPGTEATAGRSRG